MSPLFRRVHRPNLLPITNLFPTSDCLRYLSVWCRIASDNFWNALVCFKPPGLLIGNVWVPVMHFCACPIHRNVNWRVGWSLGSYRLISAQPLIGQPYLYKLSSVGIGGSVLTILTQFVSNRSQHVIMDSCCSKLVIIVWGVPQGSVLCPLLFLLYTSKLFSIL